VVVAALAATSQKGGVEGLLASILGDVVSAATQPVNPGTQQSQSAATNSQQVLPMQLDAGSVQKMMSPIRLRRLKRRRRIHVLGASYLGIKLILVMRQFVTFVSHLIIFLVHVLFFRLLNHHSLCMGMRSNNLCSLRCPLGVHTNQRLTM
jgi:hypothetical protein